MTVHRQRGAAHPFRFLMRVPVPWVFVLTYLVGVVLGRLFPYDIRSSGLLWASGPAGAVLLAAGGACAAWSLLIFHKARTTTVPGRVSRTLVTWGPYRLTRNPMYVSLIIAYLGEAGILKQVWPVAVLPLLVAYINWLVIPVEEDRLQDVFEEEYERYRGRVRRWI